MNAKNQNQYPGHSELNKRLKLNNAEPVTIDEYETLSKFAKAYELELDRNKRRRKIARLVLYIIGLLGVAALDILSISIIELIHQIITK